MPRSNQYERSVWRLIQSPPERGAWNMAVDEALLAGVRRGESGPILRLYAWNPPCISLGYAQSIHDVDRDRLAALGWDLVRRPTGGKAILHTDELTYAVITPHDEPRMAQGILDSYHTLARALLQALIRLGIPAEISGPAQKESDPGPVCFEAPSDYEITVGGKKIVGSAQARRKGGILQHGTFPLTGDLARINQVLVYPDERARQIAASRLDARATTAEQARGKSIPVAIAAAAFVEAFADVLNIQINRSGLSGQEEAEAERLAAEYFVKYQVGE